MPAFTDVARVREKFQWTDADADTALVDAAIADTHTEILRVLDPQFDIPTPDDALVLGETLLAGAHVLHSLASGDAAAKQRVRIGGSELARGIRGPELRVLAAEAEARAWDTLEPFLRDRPAAKVAAATDTVPILGED